MIFFSTKPHVAAGTKNWQKVASKFNAAYESNRDYPDGDPEPPKDDTDEVQKKIKTYHIM